MAKTLMRFTGVGGQGVLLAGSIFAAAKINDGGYGLKTATYTSQVRGGPTVVDITLSEIKRNGILLRFQLLLLQKKK